MSEEDFNNSVWWGTAQPMPAAPAPAPVLSPLAQQLQNLLNYTDPGYVPPLPSLTAQELAYSRDPYNTPGYATNTASGIPAKIINGNPIPREYFVGLLLMPDWAYVDGEGNVVGPSQADRGNDNYARRMLALLDSYGANSTAGLPASVQAQLPGGGRFVENNESFGVQLRNFITSPPVLLVASFGAGAALSGASAATDASAAASAPTGGGLATDIAAAGAPGASLTTADLGISATDVAASAPTVTAATSATTATAATAGATSSTAGALGTTAQAVADKALAALAAAGKGTLSALLGTAGTKLLGALKPSSAAPVSTALAPSSSAAAAPALPSFLGPLLIAAAAAVALMG